jgi:Protein of unknown function, DUF547
MSPLHNVNRRLWLHAALAGSAAVLGTRPARAQAGAFDHAHGAWTALLKKHVVLLGNGRASQLRYAGIAAERGALKDYLAALAAVTPQAFAAFGRAQQMAFLINAYNAATVELILTKYPKLSSIKEVAGFLTNPWKQKIVPLLGTTMSLDQIEHDTLRARGRYDDPRIHFAVNCASVGCPMLREEAFVSERLDAQLAEQARRFMSDRSRNRWSVERQRLEVSRIFDWYGEDFALGHQGIASLGAFMARHADVLADAPADRERIRSQKVDIGFLEYDWKLNDAA